MVWCKAGRGPCERLAYSRAVAPGATGPRRWWCKAERGHCPATPSASAIAGSPPYHTVSGTRRLVAPPAGRLAAGLAWTRRVVTRRGRGVPVETSLVPPQLAGRHHYPTQPPTPAASPQLGLTQIRPKKGPGNGHVCRSKCAGWSHESSHRQRRQAALSAAQYPAQSAAPFGSPLRTAAPHGPRARRTSAALLPCAPPRRLSNDWLRAFPQPHGSGPLAPPPPPHLPTGPPDGRLPPASPLSHAETPATQSGALHLPISPLRTSCPHVAPPPAGPPPPRAPNRRRPPLFHTPPPPPTTPPTVAARGQRKRRQRFYLLTIPPDTLPPGASGGVAREALRRRPR